MSAYPISRLVKAAMTCQHCDLLLQVIEAFQPGWVEENKEAGATVNITYPDAEKREHLKVIDIKLNSSPPEQIIDKEDFPTSASSFHFLKRAIGT